MLLLILRRAGATSSSPRLANRAATQVSVDNLLEVAALLDSLRRSGRARTSHHPGRPRRRPGLPRRPGRMWAAC